MNRFNPGKIKRMLGISYLGSCDSSPKLIKSCGRNVMTYGVYLAPHDISGHNVCPCSQNCNRYCLNGSGRNKIELLVNRDGGPIQASRIKKTKLFFDDRNAFMQLLIHEIIRSKKKAQAEGMQFAIRLNCTSDISLEEFVLDGKNILQLFSDIQFYDYTKVPERLQLMEKYGNYDLTFSFDGENWDACKAALKHGVRVAAVFENTLPDEFEGYPVIDANKDDARFLDEGGVICGLTYKRVANDYVDGVFHKPETTFINRNINEIKKQ